jgi:SAM-dependent methyltransferase
MAIEAQLHWYDGRLRSLDRLLVPDTALAGDGRWQALQAQVEAGVACELAATPWIEPRNQPLATLPVQALHLPGHARPGRFYPRLAFPGLAQGPRDMSPVRLLQRDGDLLHADPNHPLADLQVNLRLLDSPLACAPGSRLFDLFAGPGMQRPVPDPRATYLGIDALRREDEEPDAVFYVQPRFAHHLDAACRQQIAALYARLLPAHARVLDLMTSWTSHLPDRAWPQGAPQHLAGLGLNGQELDANRLLHERVVKDLNERPQLPWADDQFDAVLCTASIEYLIHPLAVVGEVRRVLKPGGLFAVSFSDRWFPPKAIRIWSELHPFERAGLVASLLAATGFDDLHCETLRGLKRPEDDKYSAQRAFSDPLFAVWGRVPMA